MIKQIDLPHRRNMKERLEYIDDVHCDQSEEWRETEKARVLREIDKAEQSLNVAINEGLRIWHERPFSNLEGVHFIMYREDGPEHDPRLIKMAFEIFAKTGRLPSPSEINEMNNEG
jgi:tryptophan synthase beta subunit